MKKREVRRQKSDGMCRNFGSSDFSLLAFCLLFTPSSAGKDMYRQA